MDGKDRIRYGLPTPTEVLGKTGREILQAIIDGDLPQPPISETMSFWITEIGSGLQCSRVSLVRTCSIRWAACMAAGR